MKAAQLTVLQGSAIPSCTADCVAWKCDQTCYLAIYDPVQTNVQAVLEDTMFVATYTYAPPSRLLVTSTARENCCAQARSCRASRIIIA